MDFFSFAIPSMFVAVPIILIIVKKKWRKLINSIKPFIDTFKPSYNVDVTMYHFIPGFPVKAKRTRHSFKKGEFEEAKSFYDKASKKTRDTKVAPVEISLVRGKRRVVSRRLFDPVKALEKMRISA